MDFIEIYSLSDLFYTLAGLVLLAFKLWYITIPVMLYIFRNAGKREQTEIANRLESEAEERSEEWSRLVNRSDER